jgi:hypothetical protein
MSNDFKKVLVKDDRLCVTDSLNYAVFKGGQNVTNIRMPAISATPNSLNFVIPFPSESTVLDREVYLRTQTDYNLTFASAIAGVPQYNTAVDVSNVQNPTWTCPLVYGYNISIGSFPSQRTMETIQVQINNNISTINSADVLPALLRCADAVEWERYNLTASAVDRLVSPSFEVQSQLNNNVASYDLAQGNKYIPNGSFANQLIPLDPTTPFVNGQPNVLTVYPETGTANFLLRVQSTEPLIAPPFIWNQTLSNRAGIYGIQNLQITANYGSLFKAIKLSQLAGVADNTSAYVSGLGINLQLPALNTLSQNVVNAELLMKYITPHSTDIMAQRNVIPYLEYPRFISSNFGITSSSGQPGSIIANATVTEPCVGGQQLLSLTSTVLQSQTFTLNQVPDKLIIYVRPDSSYRNNSNYNDFVLPITNISIQFNNHAGILANATQEMLFHMSQEAGSNQDWLEFTGVANAVAQRQAGLLSGVFTTYPYDSGSEVSVNVPERQLSGVVPLAYQVPTIGSYLMLDMARHLELTEPYFAPGSLGSFQVQFNITVQNQNIVGTTSNPDGITPEIVLLPVNSGLLVTERGQSSCYTGILTKQDVLDASLQEPLSHLHVARVVGRGHQDSGRSLPKHILPGMSRKGFAPATNASMDKRLM